MDWKKYLSLVFLCACVTSTRKIDVCVLDVPADIANCARNDKQYEKRVSELSQWTAMSDVDFEVVGNKLAECNVNGSLPREDIFLKLNVCVLYPEDNLQGAVCTRENKTEVVPMDKVDGFIATDESGINKIKAKFEFCMRKQ